VETQFFDVFSIFFQNLNG